MRILFNSEKGGTGKTTLSTLLAAYLAMRGKRVLVIDLDSIQGHATEMFGLEKGPGLYECIVRGVPLADRVRPAMPETWVPDGATPAGSVDVLPTNYEAASIPFLISDELALDALLTPSQPPPRAGEGHGSGYDVTIIDSPPSGGMMLTLAWYAADAVIVPVQMERLSVAGLMGTISRAEERGVDLLGIVPNMVEMNTLLHRMYYEQLADAAGEYGWPVLEPIARRIAWGESSHLGEMIYSVDAEMSKARLEAIGFCKAVEQVMARRMGG